MKKVIILLFSVSLFLSNDAVADEESEIKYLTKRDGNKIYHFRVIINGKNLDVIDGQFYNSISKWGKNCVTNENANSEALQLINNKLKDGYIETEFKESKENTYEIYDKAKYHFNGRFFPKIWMKIRHSFIRECMLAGLQKMICLIRNGQNY